LDDLIIVRSDGHPTYNFVVVVDDWDMGITHVIRGDDHINNTPRQINLFNALGAPLPVFAHLPMILGEDGKRLSKRHGAVNVLQFKELGVLPHALLNYLVRLGWSSGDQEIFSREEMIAAFNLNQVSRGVSMFNYEKLYWLNQHYLKSEPSESVLKALQWQFEQHGMDWRNGPPLAELLKLQADRCQSLSEICEKSRYFYEDTLLYDEAAIKKHCQPALIEPLNALHVLFQALENWQKDDLQECINDICVQFSLNMGKIAQPLRIAVTGSTMSPSIDATLYLIGKTRVLQRLKRMLNQNF
jgi:glutamyl-tRNA synthetase